MDFVWDALVAASVLVTLLGVPYLVVQNRKRVPHLRFDFAGGSRSEFERDGYTWGRLEWSGELINLSMDPNTIHRVFYVVWRTDKRNDVHTLGYGNTTITHADGGPLALPLTLQGREGIKVQVTTEILLGRDNAQVTKLFRDLRELDGTTAPFYLPKYEWDLALEDIDGRWFDHQGLPRSRKAIELRWTIDNARERAREGERGPLRNHRTRMLLEDLRFTVKRLLRRIGL